HWNILCQVYNRAVASERKLDLMNYYPDEYEIYVLRSMGVEGEEKVCKIPLYELDRTENFDHLTCLALPPYEEDKLKPSMDRLLGVMAKLRGPEGCPWDRKQTHLSLRPYLLEETYEVLDALDQGDMHKLCEELGDLLLQIVFHAQLATEKQEFSFEDVATTLVEKLLRRHPHVFSDAIAESASDVVETWEKIKVKEAGGRSSIFDGLTQGLPATLYAKKVQGRAARVGFDWPNMDGAVAKVNEELAELLEASTWEQQEAELGDLLFSVVNISRFVDVDPELALRHTIAKFIKRFAFMDEYCIRNNTELHTLSLEQLDKIWELAKN
ncbi:MAG: nucleoside triphosphate pyrophosphohydrolase, partial [Peptococcaceae bacterium]|nr:nucleoside triphosphate pyrophosphohydrolase [Peptococcaceae bacterium]